MIPKKAKVFFKNKNITGHDFQIMKWIAIAAIILSIILSAVIFRMAGRNRIVAVVDQLGQPHPAKVKDEEIYNVVNYKQFIRGFLGYMWNWDETTFSEQIVRLKELMTDKAWQDLTVEIKNEGYIDRIKNYDMTSSLQVHKISKAKPYYNDEDQKIGWYVEVEAVKIRIIDMIDRVQPYKYTIAFKSTDLTPSNIWGLKVFKFEQEGIKKKGALLE